MVHSAQILVSSIQMKILIATKNKGKLEEIQEMLVGEDGICAEFVSLEEVGCTDDFKEEGASFEENALGKARFFFSKTGIPTVVDDSGIFVEALADELGVKTRRWGVGEAASDEEWLAHFMNRMREETRRGAKFICAAAYVSGEEEKVFIGETSGVIAESIEVSVKKGIPLSSVFRPEGEERVYAALSLEEKNRLSHRGKAFLQLKNYVKEQIK
ncbi:MAG: non-canonical purine NTP pyrophosphatase [Candidatus Gracilibacteria bacterium]|jgi:XTP/dITP diphosphohydrolase